MINQKDPFTEKQEREFLAFIREQPSCLSGNIPCVPAHVRRVAYGAATARKPRIFAVPLTYEEHQYQHQHGELGVIVKYLPWRRWGAEMEDIGAKNWFEQQALKYRNEFLQQGK